MSENGTLGLENRTRKSSDFRQKKGKKGPKSEQKCSVFGHFASLDHFRYKKKHSFIKCSSLVSQLGCSDFRQCLKTEPFGNGTLFKVSEI